MTDRGLPIIEPVAASGACCEACAAESADPDSAPPVAGPEQTTNVAIRAQLVVLEPDQRRSVARMTDRRITLAGLLISACFLALAVAAATLPEPVRRGVWLPIHLALAGAAGTAVASVLPFFVAALSVAPPMGPMVRGGAIGLIAGGAAAASLGVAGSIVPLALAGALGYLAGLAGTAVAAFWPLRASRGPRRPLVVAAYGAALAQVALGVGLVVAMLAGVPPVVEGWAQLKPAHAWLNVFGFLSLVIAATLIHLAPTVAGTRIAPRRSAVLALAGLAMGAPLVALGMALGDDRVARIGALAELLGAISLMAHALAVWHDRSAWTTDPGWHRVALWSLMAAPAWFLVAVTLASGRILGLGAVPEAWSLGGIAAPLAIGWVVQVLIGAWSHLLPSIGPGDMAAHADQRAGLGRAATGRVIVLNLGVALVTIGGSLAWTAGIVIGSIVCGGAILLSLVIFVDAARTGRLEPRRPLPAVSGG